MKKVALLLGLVLLVGCLDLEEEISGRWEGVYQMSSESDQHKLVFLLNQDADHLAGSVILDDWSMPIETGIITGSNIEVTAKYDIKISGSSYNFSGQLEEDQIIGKVSAHHYAFTDGTNEQGKF